MPAQDYFAPIGRASCKDQYCALLKEGNVLFNDAPNIFYLRLYGVGRGKEPFRLRERKPAAATWATPSD